PRPWWERGRERGQKAAFTLAEVLITLGIIGVVAAMTIPGLIQNNKATRLRSQFLKSYSTIQQAFRQMEADDVSLDPATYRTRTFYKSFKNYFKAAQDCGVGGAYLCNNLAGTSYHTLTGVATPSLFQGDQFLDDGMILLSDGTLLFINNAALSLYVSVDLNGYNTPPNRWGYDLFMFQFLDGELRTMGSENTDFQDAEQYCSLTSTNKLNGVACAHKAKTDSDYFKWVVKTLK
ncbi:MAG: prepilin-type N-terminal cleavage/methylation domain-containing protein, partial [Muribaculaceae bacterium]|nr:prepilin-type N-terminal cleavage/methylation domain-containing protein [Muribaculaceae bacterium]